MLEDYSPSRLYPTSDENQVSNRFAYLADKESLKRLVADLCKTLHHPVAIIDYNALENAEITEKLESMVEMFPMRRSCSLFRKCAGDEYCKQCDNFHAKCMGIDKEIIEQRIRENKDNAPDFFYPDYKDNLPRVFDEFSRPVVEYHCPMLGYRELLFPLMYQGKLFGVIFAGQIMILQEDDSKTNEAIQASFFALKKPEVLFQSFLDNYNMASVRRLTCKSVTNLIKSSDRNAKVYDGILAFKRTSDAELDYYSKNFEKKKDYYEFIRKVCSAIGDVEYTISKLYEEKRQQIIVDALQPIAKEYDEYYNRVRTIKFRNIHEQRTYELKYAWDALESYTRMIAQQPSIKKLINAIIVFGSGQSLKIESSNRKKYVFSVPDDVTYENEYVDFPSDQLIGISDYVSSLKEQEALDGLSGHLPKDNVILIRCRSIAVLILAAELKGHEALYQSLVDAIGKDLTRINREISLCTANLMKEKYLLTLRMYRHENAHLSTRLMDDIDRYFDKDELRFLRMPEKKQQLICDDMRYTVQLISNVADNIGFITGSHIPTGEATSFDVVNMLYKWQVMFRDELENRNLDIIVHRGGHTSAVGHKLSMLLKKFAQEITRQDGDYKEAPKEIATNSQLFELLVYNLVDNAVKYAYRGTNIYMIWSRIEGCYELSLTSYGPKMEEGTSMYELYVRGRNNQDGQGDGIGLYVVDRIAKILGITVSHNSERISKYNVPLIPWYINTDFSRKKDYKRIPDSELLNYDDMSQAILAINEFSYTTIQERDITVKYLCQRIARETWRTTFHVKIPVKQKTD